MCEWDREVPMSGSAVRAGDLASVCVCVCVQRVSRWSIYNIWQWGWGSLGPLGCAPLRRLTISSSC